GTGPRETDEPGPSWGVPGSRAHRVARWAGPLAPRHAGLLAQNLVGQGVGVVDLAQRLDDARGGDGDGAGLHVVVAEVPGQRLDVAVEDQPHHLGVAVD